MSIIPYSKTSIFPHSNIDNDFKILSYFSPRDQVKFSILNHRTYAILNNDDYFKALFEKYSAVSCDRYLSTYYLKNCWKIGCFYIEPQSKPIHFNESLLREPITQFFPIQPAKIKREIEEICGTRHKDPSSIIHLTWQYFEKSFDNSVGMYEKLQNATNVLWQSACKLENPNVYMRTEIPKTFERMVGIISRDDHFKDTLMGLDESLGSSDAPELMRAYSVALKKQKLGQLLTIEEEQYIEAGKGLRKWQQYDILENKRAFLQENLDVAEATLKILTHPSKREAASKNFEKINRSRLEKLFSAYYLNQCSLQIESVLEHPIEGTDPRHQKIRTLINSCSPDIKGRVWWELYDSAANGVTEDSWSEHHFHEHLPALKSFVEHMRLELYFECRSLNLFPNLENPNFSDS